MEVEQLPMMTPTNKMIPTFRVFLKEEEDQLASIEIESGPYSGVVYSYGVVGIKDSKSAKDVTIEFSYTVLENENLIKNRKEFEDVLSEILYEIVTESENH